MARTRTKAAISVLWTAVLTVLLFGAPPASAASTAPPVRVIEVSAGHNTLTLRLDEPMPASEAATTARTLRQDMQAAAALTVPDIMFCTTGRSYTDSNGTLNLARFCDLRQLRWDYRISEGVQAIIVSPVSETGLWYFINGVRQPRNSPHVEPRDYLFHGTMSGIDTGVTVDYQDYMTFRHNIGPGGTGSITFAGSVRMT
ncbi:MAG: hypothetical protein ACRDSP_16945 [Pseudonocardiaceae bacterium]